MKMIDECEFYMWSLGINKDNAVVMNWCQHPNEGTAIGYNLAAADFRKLGEMFLKHAKTMQKAEDEKAKEERKKRDKADKEHKKRKTKEHKKRKTKARNENPKCTDYDDEGRCNGCGQFDCYECDWD